MRLMPPEIYLDAEGPPVGILEDSLTRGFARNYFTQEHGLPFTAGRVTLRWFRHDPDYEREVLADGGSEPDEGWPVWVCNAGDEGAAPYWYFEERG